MVRESEHQGRRSEHPGEAARCQLNQPTPPLEGRRQMKHIIILINLFLIALIVAPAAAQADTLSDKSEKLVSILSPFIGDFEGDHEEMKLNAHFNARWNQTKTAMFFTWTSNLKESKKKLCIQCTVEN